MRSLAGCLQTPQPHAHVASKTQFVGVMPRGGHNKTPESLKIAAGTARAGTALDRANAAARGSAMSELGQVSPPVLESLTLNLRTA